MRSVGKVLPPRCPFCGSELPRPVETTISDTEKGLSGTCSCGAVYLVDPTAKNVGLMMAQALNMIADTLRKDVGDLIPEADYEDAVLSYDWRSHRSGGVSQGYMDGSGRLYIFKINNHP